MTGKLRWLLRHGWQQLSSLHLVALSAMLLIVLLEIFAINPLSQQITEAEQRQADLLAAQAHSTRHVQRDVLREQGDLASLLALLPPVSTRTAELKDIEALARQHNLIWLGTDYVTADTQAMPPGMARQRLRISLQGSFSSWRACLHDLLAKKAFVAVDGMNFVAGTPQTPSSIQLDVSLFFRQADHKSVGTAPAGVSGP
jgi:hypothetical protein